MLPLTNARWGFESNCFACEPANPTGLRVPFFHDELSRRVVASFEFDDRFSGAPTYVHGGVVLTVLDEAMAWAAIAIAGQWAVTKETSASFERPVRIGRPHEVTATVEGESDGEIEARAEIKDAKDRVCAVARAIFSPLGEAQATDATGASVSPSDQPFVRDR